MARLSAAVAAIRTAVRRELAALPPDSTVLVACSGGPDSMALAACCAFVAPRIGLRAGLITVDHGLQAGSARQAESVAEWARDQGFDPVEIATVTVDVRDGGPEAAARDARYAALSAACRRHDAAAVLLGHTRNDQAETVLLALARGAGPRGIAAMPVRRGDLLRPLLEVSREQTVDCCRELRLSTWDDPHNVDPAYARSRVRAVMPQLTGVLGERLVGNLARTAQLVADDNAALDSYADELLRRATMTAAREPSLDIAELAAAPRAVRSRAIRMWVLDNGADGESLSFVHITAVEALVTRWRGQGPTSLPGGLWVGRESGGLTIARKA